MSLCKGRAASLIVYKNGQVNISANLKKEAKLLKYFQAYKQLDDIHFEPFVVESGGELVETRFALNRV